MKFKFLTPIFCFRWYRDSSTTPLEAPVSHGGSKDLQTTSTLSITPRREDDGAKFKCVVWNRAMGEGQRLETTVTLSVNCKYNNSITIYPIMTSAACNKKYKETTRFLFRMPFRFWSLRPQFSLFSL
jgi:CD80-like C2-set immunoglobulin domain